MNPKQVNWSDPHPPVPPGATLIYLSAGRFAVVDKADAPRLREWAWQISYQQSGHCYATRRVRNTRPTIVRMHRTVIQVGEGQQVDHVNGDTLDNRRANLRIATASENQRNIGPHRDNTSGFKGVFFIGDKPRTKPWHAQIVIDGRQVSLGYHATKEDAARDYDAAAKRLHGSFARLNFEE